MNEENNKPKSYLLGNVKVSKWTNNGDMISYTFEKSYKDDKDEWQTTKSFNSYELAKLRSLIDKIIAEDVKVYE